MVGIPIIGVAHEAMDLKALAVPEIYADQNELDYAALQAAVKDGRAQATTQI